MFLPFKISIQEIQKLLYRNDYKKQSLKYTIFVNNVNNAIKGSINPELFISDFDDEINGSKLRDEWFPVDLIEQQFDVFISHSHRDEESKRTISLFASWLYDIYGIKSFIDSYYWDYAGNLIDELNNHFSNPRKVGTSTNYNYSSAKFINSCVDIMLANALTDMISHIDCVLFIDSDNSLSYHKSNGRYSANMTSSPWIYHEINFVNHSKWETPLYYKQHIADASYKPRIRLFSEGAKFMLPVDIDRFYPMDYKKFMRLKGMRKDALCSWFDLYDEDEIDETLYKIILND